MASGVSSPFHKSLHITEGTETPACLTVRSDHGQSFGEHGKYAAHAQYYNELMRTALIIRGPRLRRSRRVEQLVQGIDLLPTQSSVQNGRESSNEEGGPMGSGGRVGG